MSKSKIDRVMDDVTSCLICITLSLGLGVADPHFEGSKTVVDQIHMIHKT